MKCSHLFLVFLFCDILYIQHGHNILVMANRVLLQGPGTRRRQQQQQQQQVGRGMARSQRRGLRRGGNLSGRGRGITARVGFNNNRQQLSTRGGGVVKRRIGNLRGQGRGRYNARQKLERE